MCLIVIATAAFVIIQLIKGFRPDINSDQYNRMKNSYSASTCARQPAAVPVAFINKEKRSLMPKVQNWVK